MHGGQFAVGGQSWSCGVQCPVSSLMTREPPPDRAQASAAKLGARFAVGGATGALVELPAATRVGQQAGGARQEEEEGEPSRSAQAAEDAKAAEAARKAAKMAAMQAKLAAFQAKQKKKATEDSA